MIEKYPIIPYDEPLRESLLIIECILFFYILETAAMLFLKVYAKRKEARHFEERAFIFLNLGYAFMWMFSIISDYYATNAELWLMYQFCGYLVLIGFAGVFIFMIERNIVHFKQYLLTLIYIILSAIFIIGTLIFNIKSIFLTAPLWIFIIIVFFFYLHDLAKKKPPEGSPKNMKVEFFKFLTGYVFLIIGISFSIEVLLDPYGLEIRFIGDFFQLIGIACINWFFISIPSLSEYEWKEKILDILILKKTGHSIYHKSFQTIKEGDYDDSAISSALTTVEIMLNELTDKEGFSILEKKGDIVMIQSGKHIYGVIICKEKLNSLKLLLKHLVEKIELIYSHLLINWRGDLRIFDPIEDIINDIFV